MIQAEVSGKRLRGKELREQVHKGPCYALIPSLREPGGAEEPHQYKYQAILRKTTLMVSCQPSLEQICWDFRMWLVYDDRQLLLQS